MWGKVGGVRPWCPHAGSSAGPGLGPAALKSSRKGGRGGNTKHLHPQGLFPPPPGAALDLGSGCSGSVFLPKFAARGKPQNMFHGLLNPWEPVHLLSLAILAVWPLVIRSPSLDLSVLTWKGGLENPPCGTVGAAPGEATVKGPRPAAERPQDPCPSPSSRG